MSGDPYGLARLAADPEDPKFAGRVRFLGTQLKTAAYQAAVLSTGTPLEVWLQGLGTVLASLDPEWCQPSELTWFFSNVWLWDEVRTVPATLAEMWQRGLSTLQAICASAP